MKKEFFYLVSGYLMFLTSSFAIMGAIIFLVYKPFFLAPLLIEEALGSTSILLLGTIVFFFVYSTRFWNQGQKPKKLKDIDNEIEIIKKQIKKNELLLKYNSIRKN